MFGSNFTSRLTAELYSRIILMKPSGLTSCIRCTSSFKAIGADFGRSSHLVFIAQQRNRLRVEYLPGVASGLREHDTSVLGIGVVAKVRAFVDEAIAVRIHHDSEWVTVAIARGVLVVDVTVVVGVPLPGDRMTARPLPVGLRADVQRHADAVAGVVARAAHLRQVPSRTEIARPPFAVGFEAAAGEHERTRTDQFLAAIDQHPYTLDARRTAQQRHRACAKADADTVFRGCFVFRFHQPGAPAVGIDDDATEKLELALVVVGLATVVR